MSKLSKMSSSKTKTEWRTNMQKRSRTPLSIWPEGDKLRKTSLAWKPCWRKKFRSLATEWLQQTGMKTSMNLLLLLIKSWKYLVRRKSMKWFREWRSEHSKSQPPPRVIESSQWLETVSWWESAPSSSQVLLRSRRQGHLSVLLEGQVLSLKH